MQWVAECLRGSFWVRFRDHTIIHEIRATKVRMESAQRLARVAVFEIRTSFLLQMLDYCIGSQHRFPFVFILFFFLNLANFLSTLWSHCIRFESRVRLLKYWADQIKNTPLHVEFRRPFFLPYMFDTLLWTVEYLVIAIVPQVRKNKKCAEKKRRVPFCRRYQRWTSSRPSTHIPLVDKFIFLYY